METESGHLAAFVGAPRFELQKASRCNAGEPWTYWLIAHLRAVGISVGAVFIYRYSPQRRVAINVFQALRELKKSR